MNLLGMLCLDTQAAPVVSSADVQLCAVDADRVNNDVNGIIKKEARYLHFVRLPRDGTCRTIKNSMYIALNPTEGDLKGTEVRILVWDGAIYKQIRMCTTCALSPWRKVDTYPFDDTTQNERKKSKLFREEFRRRGILICPDGSYKIPVK